MSDIEKVAFSEIFDLFRSGENKKGAELLYKYHYGKVYGIAFSFTKEEKDSEDVVHNVIYKLLKLEASKFPTSSENTWLYKVTKNEALLFLKFKEKYISEDFLSFPIEEDKNIRNIVDMDTYYSMIKKLKEEQRLVVTLKVLGGYTHKEISEMLGKPIGTVQWIYNTSIKKLKLILTALGTSTFVFAFAFVRRLWRYIIAITTTNSETPGTTLNVPFDYKIVVNGLLCIISISIFHLILKKSDKLPTKLNKKNI